MEARVICEDCQKSEAVEKKAAEQRKEAQKLKNFLEELKQKTKHNKEQCEGMLNTACQVSKGGEKSLYRTLFGRLVHRIWSQQLHASSQLPIIINQMYHFFDVEHENWVKSKCQYCCIERNFAWNLYNKLISVKTNIVWERGYKPPEENKTFDKLVLCYEFEPFHNHWNQRQKRMAKRHNYGTDKILLGVV